MLQGTDMLRHHLARPLTILNRLSRAVVPRRTQPGAFRILLLHDVPPDHETALEVLVAHVVKHHGVLTPAEAAARLAGTVAAPPTQGGRLPCLFTFDDGFRSNAEGVCTVLDHHGVKAIFFVCPGLMDTPSGPAQQDAVARGIFEGAPDAGTRAADQTLMDWNDVAQLNDAGHTIGAHGMTHRRLSQLQGAALSDEIAGAGATLAARLGNPVDWYAYAFGDIDSISAEALAETGRHHRLCRSGVRGLNHAGTHPLALRADSIDLGDPLAYSIFILEGGLDTRYAAARNRLDDMVR